MIKFKITPERFSEACNILEYLAVIGGNRDTAIRIAPRFILGEDGEYIIKVTLDDDGDINFFENTAAAFLLMAKVTPKRLEKLAKEFTEAARGIVSPTSGGDLNGPMSTTPEQPPPGS